MASDEGDEVRVFGEYHRARITGRLEDDGVLRVAQLQVTHRQRGDVRGQNVSKQNQRRPQDATVNVKPEVGQGVKL